MEFHSTSIIFLFRATSDCLLFQFALNFPISIIHPLSLSIESIPYFQPSPRLTLFTHSQHPFNFFFVLISNFGYSHVRETIPRSPHHHTMDCMEKSPSLYVYCKGFRSSTSRMCASSWVFIGVMLLLFSILPYSAPEYFVLVPYFRPYQYCHAISPSLQFNFQQEFIAFYLWPILVLCSVVFIWPRSSFVFGYTDIKQ